MRESKQESTHQATAHLKPQAAESSVGLLTAPEVHAPVVSRIQRLGRSPAGGFGGAIAPHPTQNQNLVLHLQRQYGNAYVQRMVALSRQGDGEADAAPEVEAGIEQARGSGQPLERTVQRQMESAFGTDFGGVRVHTDSSADSLNQALSARAFTTGQDIFFRQGEYSPGSSGGKELLAHELTHVVQQTGGVQARRIQPKLAIGQPNDSYEQEADRVADQVMHMPEPSVQRQMGAEENEPEREPTGLDVPTMVTQEEQSGSVSDAPSATYIVPFDRNPLAAPGERIIFRGDFTDASPASYQLEYSTTGGHFTSATGPTTRTIGGLVSGNVDFFVPTPWIGTSTVQVVLRVKKISDNSIVRTETWDFGLKARYPTTMTQREGTGEVNLPGVYHYDIGPVVVPYAPPFYQHQTILERFGNWSLANIGPADIAVPYRTAHALNSAADVSLHFLGNYAGNNGTFTVDANDQIADQHGGHPNLANLVSNLATPKDIEVALPQTYEAQPGTALGNYTVTRILKADGTTWKVKKG